MQEKIKQKGFIQIPILVTIIAGVLIVGGISYIGVKQYQNYQTQKIEKEKQTQELTKLQQDKENQTEEEKINQDLEIAKLKEEMDALKNKKPETITQTIIKEVPPQTPPQATEPNLSTIIVQWKPLIAHISCKWVYYATGEFLATADGSGILMQYNDGVYIITNRHILETEFEPIEDKGKFVADYCDITFSNNDSVFRVFTSGFKGSSINDLAGFKIDNPTDYIKNLSSKGFVNCRSKAQIGDSVVILGYPSIGSKTDITATRGIVSGYEGNYYITDAKVEHGNSGGAAILLKDNCYLGIPTYAVSGSVESLARILDVNAFK